MEFQVQLYLREHSDGSFSIQVPGVDDLQIYTRDLPRAMEDLELVLNDRLERLHPRYLHTYAVSSKLRLEEIELPGALIREGTLGPEEIPTRAIALIARDRRWQRIWLPRWDVRHWVKVGEDPVEATVAFMQGHLKKIPQEKRLKRRFSKREWMETLTIDVDPALLSDFLEGKMHSKMLPEPIPKEKEDDEDEEHDSEKGKKKGKSKKKKRPPTPTFKKIGVHLSHLAKEQELERAHGRKREVSELLGILQAPGSCAFAIVGESGVGKTTILHELVHQIRSKATPEPFRTRPVWFVDASRIIAGDGWFGDWQRQCMDLIQESMDAEVIWYVGNLLALLDAGKSIGSDQNVALMLKPYLAGKRITMVGECTPRMWTQLEMRDAGFARLFTPYRIEEPPAHETREILEGVAKDLHEEQDVALKPQAIRALEDLCGRYSADASRLGTSIHFMRRLVDALTPEEDEPARVVGRAEVVEHFCGETGMPPFLIRDDQPMDPDAVWMHFRSRIIGQDEAVRRMTDLVALMKSGLSDLNRPMGSFLFVGPTGVGKTEMAKALTEFLFGHKKRMVRFDMSEFISPDSVHRFLGTETQEGLLTSQVRRSPFCVILLDEIEKAHPAIFDVLLQVLGEARLTDQAGRTADFRNTVVLMTSNLGVETFKSRAGFGDPSARTFREHFMAEAERFFRPEFFNRIDHIVPFMPLEAEAIELITERELDRFQNREGLRQRELTLTLTPEVHEWIAERGVEPRYGARPLKRLIEDKLTVPLARHLSGLGSGRGHTLEVAAEGEALVFQGHDGGSSPGAPKHVRARLQEFLDEINRTRNILQKWITSQPFQEIEHDVRLLDRLSQDKNFWVDKKRAEERVRHTRDQRELLESFRELREQIYSLEDLGYELYYNRDDSSLEDLKKEHKAFLAMLRERELDLYGQRFRNPDLAYIYLRSNAISEEFLKSILEIYIAIAEKKGWSVSGYHSIEDPVEPKKSKRKSKKKAGEEEGEKKKEDPFDPNDPSSKHRNRDPAAWRWSPPCTLGEAPEEENAGARSTRIKGFLSQLTVGKAHNPRVLVVEGPRVAQYFANETGNHFLIGDNEIKQVSVCFDSRSTKRHPLEVFPLFKSRNKRRTRRDKHIIEDHVLDMSLSLIPRMEKRYLRFMLAALYDDVFGPGSYPIFQQDYV